MKPLTPAQRILQINSTASYQQQLRDTPSDHPARKFFADRGLGAQIVESFRLGWCGEPYAPEHEKLRGRLVIPNLIFGQDGTERPVGQKFRLLDHGGKGDDRPKFLYPSHQGPLRLYNLRAISMATDTIVITEGESDCWVATKAGYHAVGVPGAQVLGKAGNYRLRLLQGFSRVILLQDSDESGEDLVRSLEPVDGLEVRSMAPYKDVSKFYEAEGLDALAARIEGIE